jgi:hypothetical protein
MTKTWWEAPMGGSVLSSKQNERWATQAQLTEPLVLIDRKSKMDTWQCFYIGPYLTILGMEKMHLHCISLFIEKKIPNALEHFVYNWNCNLHS